MSQSADLVSADRLGQVLIGQQLQVEEGAADSAPAPALQAPTDVSAAGIVLENQRPNTSSLSEGVASVGGVPQPVVGEFVPSTVGEPATHSLAAGYQGETSGLGGGGGMLDDGFGETGAAGSGPMDGLQPGTASAQAGGTAAAAASHHASRAEPPAHHAKRKMSEMGEVGGQSGAAGGAEEAGEEVQECGVQGQTGQSEQLLAPDLSPGRDHDLLSGLGLNRVPSDVAMVTGDAPFDEQGFFDQLPPLVPEASVDDCDSHMARAIKESLAEARAQQQRQQQACGSEGAEQAATFVDAVGEHANRPSDADIIAWENQIKEAEVKRVPLMGDREPLDELAAEYAAGSAIYRQKIDKLNETYGSIRRTRGDGNCFFRSFWFGYIEHLLLVGDMEEQRRMLSQLEKLKKELVEVGGYDEIVVETPLDMVLQMLRAVGEPLEPLTIEGLESSVRDEDISGYPVWLLRMVTSCEIKRRADFFAPFIMGLSDMDVATFCSKCVDPMGEEADHVQLVALTDALKVPVRVVYLDRSLAPGGGSGDGSGGMHVDVHDFVPEGSAAKTLPRVHLLYRPGHYDLLYPKLG